MPQFVSRNKTMKELPKRLQGLMSNLQSSVSSSSEIELSFKPSIKKWSKKEILGHLIDSATYNLQRFTEIQYEEKPFVVKPYAQDYLVKINDYQNMPIEDALSLCIGLNKRIQYLMQSQSSKTLSYPIVLPNNQTSDLKFLMEDYVDHLEHHLNQIME